MSNSGNSGKGNAYQASAGAYGGAGDALTKSADIYNSIRPGGVDTVKPQLTGGTGFNASLMNSANVADPSRISQGISGYMNPYTQNVVDRAAQDMNRLTTQQNAQVGREAGASGAFGGARHGLVEATNLAEGQRNIGDMSAQMRQQGFDTAANLSAQDIGNRMNTNQFNANLMQQARTNNQAYQNQASQFGAANQMSANLANQGARTAADQFNANAKNQRDMEAANVKLARAGGMAGLSGQAQSLGQNLFSTGQQVSAGQTAAGAAQQSQLQGILDAAGGQYNQFMNMPQNLLNMQLGALGMNPLTSATTTTGQYKPGLLDWASLGGQTLAGKGGGGK